MADLWTPADDPGCQLWLDPSDDESITLDADGRIEQIVDKSGAGHNAVQATATLRPRGMSGLIMLDGASYLDLQNLVLIGGQWLFAAGVAMLSSTSTYGRLLSVINASQSNEYGTADSAIAIGRNSSQVDGCIYAQNKVAGTTTGDWGYTRGGVLVTAIRDSELRAYINGRGGAAQTTGTPMSLNTTGGGRLGATVTTGGDRWQGPVGHVVVSSDTSIDNQQRIEGFVAHAMGLAGELESTHPYANSPSGGLTLVTVGNRAFKPGAPDVPAEYVQIHRYPDGRLVSTVETDVNGDWSIDLLPGDYTVTYLLTDCAPITHGPYVIAAP